MATSDERRLKKLQGLLPDALARLVDELAAKERCDPLMLLADLVRTEASARLLRSPSSGERAASSRKRRASEGARQAFGYDLGVHPAMALAPAQETGLVAFQASAMTHEQAAALGGALARPEDVLELDEAALLPE